MNPIVFVGVAAALLAAVAVGLLVRPVMSGRMAWTALVAAAATAVVTVVVGRALGLGTLEFLIGIAALALPVSLLVEAAAVASGAGEFARWLLMLLWGVVVFPITALVPLTLTAGCVAPDCGFEDFGAALPLVVSSAAYVLLGKPAHLDHTSDRGFVVGGLLLWFASAVWLTHLEGTVDEFTPRIALAAIVGPAAGAVGWLLVDLLRNTRRDTGQSLMLGLAAGMVATLPGAVSVQVPWSPIVGLLAGGLASLVYSLHRVTAAGLAPRWGATVLVAALVGFVAPAISGETVGVMFSGRAAVLVVPVLAFFAVATFSVLVSAPVWVLLRRRWARSRT
ncbi:MAG: hypothetical protein ABI632_11645 [Pseudolysinimonas sp.]